MRRIQVIGPDGEMDEKGWLGGPVNPLPAKCPDCGFPDLDFVPQPYYLVRSKTLSPVEMACAQHGNFLFRERVKRILELLAPGDCTFYPTYFQNSEEQTPWWLAVPQHQMEIGVVKPEIARCATCNEPASAHPGTQFSEWLNVDTDRDVLKAKTWGSSERSWKEWIFRNQYMSIRMFGLLTAVKARGIVEIISRTPLNVEETAWIEAQKAVLGEAGIPLHATGTLSPDSEKWFKAFLKRNGKKLPNPDFKPLEKKARVKLPKSYKDFLTKAGKMSFESSTGETPPYRILDLKELDVTSYRKGVKEYSDEASAEVDGIAFAVDDHGNSLCFDCRKDCKEFEVYEYNHEMDCMEPFAGNFVECIQRLSEAETEE